MVWEEIGNTSETEIFVGLSLVNNFSVMSTLSDPVLDRGQSVLLKDTKVCHRYQSSDPSITCWNQLSSSDEGE